MKDLLNKLLLLILIGLLTFNTYLIIRDSNLIDIKIRDSIAQIEIPKAKDGKDAEVDYEKINDYIDNKVADIPRPKDGKDSVSTHTIEKTTETIIKEVPVKGDKGDTGERGPILDLQCNKAINAWQIKYEDDISWRMLNGEPIKCKVE